MAEFVEGDWKNYTFKMAKPEDYPGILEHLNQNSFRDEAGSKLIGPDEQKNKDMDGFAIGLMDQNLSFFAFDRNNNNKIVGVRVTGISRKEDGPMKAFSEVKSEILMELLPNYMELYKEANTFERLGIDHYGSFNFLSVDRAYRRQGLASEMYERVLKLLKSEGIPAALAVNTSPQSQNLARKFGFSELARKKLKDYKKRDGSILFPRAGDDQVAIVMAKLI